MGFTSLQVCMDSSDWLQGEISEEGTGMDSSSPMTTPTVDEMLTCSRPLIERGLRPHPEQALKCPRCDSTHTKFCYYNNYSLSQPRYFCKTCRRYWTKGGTLRNIPVGGGCRRNKKASSKKSSSADHHNHHQPATSSSPMMLNQQSVDMSPNPTHLQLGFSDQLQFSSLHAAAGLYSHGGTSASPYLLESPAPVDFMENKYEAILGGLDGFIGNGDNFVGAPAVNFHGVCSPPFGLSSSLVHGDPLESCQMLMLPYHENDRRNHRGFDQNNEIEVKPDTTILSLQWHNSDAGKDSFGYNFGGLGSWTGSMSGYGSSAMNPLV